MTIYKMNYHIDLSNVDFTKKLKLSTLFSLFQDVASMASEELGFGIDTLEKEYGVAWIVMKIRADIVRMPMLDETITIETWPIEPKKIEFERDFIVRDQTGEPIIRAISSWVIMDIKERRLRRSHSVPIHYPTVITERAMDSKFAKLKDFGHLESAYQKVIGYSDVDFNGHLNNSRYIDYMMDCFSMEEHQRYDVKSVEVHFSHEALPGETITLKKDISSVASNYVFIEGTNEKDQKTVFKSLIHIVGK